MNQYTVTYESLDAACDACALILPQRPNAATPDAIAALVAKIDWMPVPDWSSKDDNDIAIRANLYGLGLAGFLLVVTEASFAKRLGAFRVDAKGLGNLVQSHLQKYGECFFNGDVVIVELAGKRIWLFHHEGQVALLTALGR